MNIIIFKRYKIYKAYKDPRVVQRMIKLIKKYIMNFIGLIGLSLFWFFISILFFNKSLKKYESNNFFGFGG